MISADALKCYECYFFEYGTSNFIIKGILEAGNALGDKNCIKQGQDFLDVSYTFLQPFTFPHTLCH